MAKLNTADIGFEDQIWKAADKMRGNLDASEYKSVVLGLIFLKYISDKFEARYEALVDEGEGFEEIARDDRDVVDTTKVNYQLYISATDSSQCFLLNVHTGEMWRYGDGEEDGKTFIKLEMPFLIPKKE